MWRWDFGLLLLFSALIDFLCASKISLSKKPATRKAWLLLSLCTNIGLLIFFKYTYFIVDNIRSLGNATGLDGMAHFDPGLTIVLPLGISFYTFQTISYTIDVYRKVIQPTKRFITFFTFVSFWPQLIAGPVLRADEVIPQLEGERKRDARMFSSGLLLVIVGLFKKVVIADNIAPMVDFWFTQDASALTAIDIWVAAFLFGFQIYCDFSGYSDIAIGSARILGFDFPDNFQWPYMARSPREFWKRWHISLSSWIRDYLYLPLTGEKYGTHSTEGIGVAGEHGQKSTTGWRWNRALILTWLIMGLWHGAAWTFVLWGLFHGIVILVYRVSPRLQELTKKHAIVAWMLMLATVMAAWIPFRALSVEQTLEMFARILDPFAYRISTQVMALSSRLAGYSYLWAFLLTIGMVSAWRLNQWREKQNTIGIAAFAAMTLGVAVMVCMILVYLDVDTQFIYFQF